MSKILITGGAGFMGSSLADRLCLNPDNTIIIVDNLLTGIKEKIPHADNVKFIRSDVNVYKDIEPIMTSYRFDHVFHYAAVVGVKRTLENPLMVLNDIQGFKNILDLSKSINVKRVFFASSSEVYGEPVEMPQNESTTPLNSRLPYSIVKNVGEAFFKSYKATYDLDYTIFRFFNTYGYKQNTDFVVNKFIESALENLDITVYGDGLQSRTFCYIDDNIDTVIEILNKNKHINDVVNVGSDIELSVLELAQIIIKLSNSKSKIVHLRPLSEGDMTKRQPDNSKMKNILNRDLLSIEEGIKKCIEYKRNNALHFTIS